MQSLNLETKSGYFSNDNQLLTPLVVPMTSSSTQNQSKSAGTAQDTASRIAGSAGEVTQEYAQHYVAEPAKDIYSLLRDYANDKPDVAAMWCFGLGVVVGWKLRG